MGLLRFSMAARKSNIWRRVARSRVQFDVGFGERLREISRARKRNPEMDRLHAFVVVVGDEIGAHGAGFERAFVTVDDERPRIVGIEAVAPQVAMLPGHVEIVVLPKVATCVSLMSDLPFLSTKIPPSRGLTRFGQPRPSIQRVVSNMCTHISPTMPLPYSMKVRHHRRWGDRS